MTVDELFGSPGFFWTVQSTCVSRVIVWIRAMQHMGRSFASSIALKYAVISLAWFLAIINGSRPVRQCYTARQESLNSSQKGKNQYGYYNFSHIIYRNYCCFYCWHLSNIPFQKDERL